MCDHHHLRTPSPAGDVEHVTHLSENIGALFLNEEYSDVTLVIQAQRFPAHKVILAARSDYFRALLYGGMKESNSTEIELKETHSTGFRHLLKYIYTGRMILSDLKEEILLEILGLAHQYVFKELEVSVSDYLKANLKTENVCMIYDIACMYDLKTLTEKCCEFMDRNAEDIIKHNTFLQLSSGALQELITRDSFCAPEIEIFQAIQRWKESNPDAEIRGIVTAVRLPLMSMDQLLGHVRDSSLICPDALLDAIKIKNASRNMELKYRGFLCPEENVATMRHGAQVVRGEMKTSLLDGDNMNYDLDRGFTRHPIDDDHGQGVVIKLNMPYIINTMRMLLWDRDMRSYSYRIDVSMDDTDWITAVDHSKYLCRSWQYLRFPPIVVKYIRIVGTHNTVNRVFHVVSFECLFSRNPCTLENGILVPTRNVATIDDSACVIEGVSRSRNALINGDVRNYDWDSGYTCHQLGSGAIVVQLAQPYIIDSMRLLLWDCDLRSYSYYIEVSTDQQNWKLVADRKREACKSWQVITFPREAVTFIRIVGTHNTANEVFHCVHFECPAEASEVARHKKNKNQEAVSLSTNQSPRTCSQEELQEAGSEPEDEMPLMVGPLPSALLPPAPNPYQLSLQAASFLPCGPPPQPPPKPSRMLDHNAEMMQRQHGASSSSRAFHQLSAQQSNHRPLRLQVPLDSGDGFGVEPNELIEEPHDFDENNEHSD